VQLPFSQLLIQDIQSTALQNVIMASILYFTGISLEAQIDGWTYDIKLTERQTILNGQMGVWI
jgi:hypothetical protein